MGRWSDHTLIKTQSTEASKMAQQTTVSKDPSLISGTNMVDGVN